jgi:hypothetical protein
MGRKDLKHIDRGVIYVPIDNNLTDQEVNKIIEEHKKLGRTIVLYRSGKQNIKNILKELIKTTLNA